MRTLKNSNQQSEDFLNKYCILKHMYEIKKNGTDKPICGAEKEVQMWRVSMWTQRTGKQRVGRIGTSGLHIYTTMDKIGS